MEIDLEERKVSLSKKHTTENPWKDFEDKHNAGDILENMNIKSVTDFGIFVELDGGIDGLIHHSEIVVGPEEIQEKYKAGDQITVSISGMDSERERISLSLVS
jgi:small subunit ribosomal protein S1